MTAPRFTSDELAAATGGRWTGPAPAAVEGVSTDTRTLPAGSLFALSNQVYLAMTLTRDKFANDVLCLGQVSSNLSDWASGPGYTRLDQIIDLGSLEQLTVRDLSPVGSLPTRFMRLQLQRN